MANSDVWSRFADFASNAGNFLTQAGTAGVKNAELDSLQSKLATGRADLRKKYSDAAKAAGSYSDTAEFQKGLDDEVERGWKGYEASLRPRAEALSNELGHTQPNTFGTISAPPVMEPTVGGLMAPASPTQTTQSEGGVEGSSAPATNPNAVMTLTQKLKAMGAI